LGSTPAPDQCPWASACAASPTAIASDSTFTQIAIATYNACAITAQGQVYCWNVFHPLPTRIGGPAFRTVRPNGYSEGCGMGVDDKVWCWIDILAKWAPRQQ
jgi:hypothetical protein